MNPVASRRTPGRWPFFWLALTALLTLVFVGLGLWQVRRLAWKEALIAQVEARVHADPGALPATPPEGEAALAYLHVRLHGHYRWRDTVRVQGTSDLGMGVWVLTPLVQDDGSLVLVNRGFLSSDQARLLATDAPDPACPEDGPPCTVTGLVRPSEPGGTPLRRNDPGAGRWYSRDVEAIRQARHLPPLRALFVDVDEAAATSPAAQPVAGLTVIHFNNNHLGYALTWFAMGLLTPVAGAVVLRERRHANPLASRPAGCDTPEDPPPAPPA